MANGFNPYGIAEVQQNLLETLLGSEQTTRLGEFATGEQKGEMREEFQDELIAAQKKQEEELAKKRKGELWEKLLPIIGMFTTPLGAGMLSGLQGMYTTGKQSKHALAQIDKARDAGLDIDKWGKTFLGSGAKESKAASDLTLDSLEREAKISGMDLLGKGITSGISGYAMGKIGEGIKEAFAPNLDAIAEQQGYSIDPTYGASNLADLDKGFFEKLIKGLGTTDLARTLGTDEDKNDALQNFLMLINQIQGGG